MCLAIPGQVVELVDPERQLLSALDRTPTLGKTPRHFTLDPSGKFLLAANQDTGDIAVFSVQPNSGQLMPVGGLVKDAPFRWTLLEGAKGVQLAEKAMEAWAKRAWVDVPAR